MDNRRICLRRIGVKDGYKMKRRQISAIKRIRDYESRNENFHTLLNGTIGKDVFEYFMYLDPEVTNTLFDAIKILDPPPKRSRPPSVPRIPRCKIDKPRKRKDTQEPKPKEIPAAVSDLINAKRKCQKQTPKTTPLVGPFLSPPAPVPVPYTVHPSLADHDYLNSIQYSLFMQHMQMQQNCTPLAFAPILPMFHLAYLNGTNVPVVPTMVHGLCFVPTPFLTSVVDVGNQAMNIGNNEKKKEREKEKNDITKRKEKEEMKDNDENEVIDVVGEEIDNLQHTSHILSHIKREEEVDVPSRSVAAVSIPNSTVVVENGDEVIEKRLIKEEVEDTDLPSSSSFMSITEDSCTSDSISSPPSLSPPPLSPPIPVCSSLSPLISVCPSLSPSLIPPTQSITKNVSSSIKLAPSINKSKKRETRPCSVNIVQEEIVYPIVPIDPVIPQKHKKLNVIHEKMIKGNQKNSLVSSVEGSDAYSALMKIYDPKSSANVIPKKTWKSIRDGTGTEWKQPERPRKKYNTTEVIKRVVHFETNKEEKCREKEEEKCGEKEEEKEVERIDKLREVRVKKNVKRYEESGRMKGHEAECAPDILIGVGADCVEKSGTSEVEMPREKKRKIVEEREKKEKRDGGREEFDFDSSVVVRVPSIPSARNYIDQLPSYLVNTPIVNLNPPIQKKVGKPSIERMNEKRGSIPFNPRDSALAVSKEVKRRSSEIPK